MELDLCIVARRNYRLYVFTLSKNWSFLRIWWHLLKKSLMENLIFCAALVKKSSIEKFIFWCSDIRKPFFLILVFSPALSGVSIPYIELTFNRCSCSQMFFKIGVLKNFAIFTWKHLCWSLFLTKLQTWRPAT